MSLSGWRTVTAGRASLVAPDSFKGTFSAAQVAAAIGRGLEAAGEPPPDLCPLADGGEGTQSVLLTALGGETAGHLAFIEDGATAIVEVAHVAGLGPDPTPEDAWNASTAPVGELIAEADGAGAEVILVCAGGSAATDGGAGCIEAAGDVRAQIVVLCDVRAPFERAAAVFGPQKGADPATVKRLAKRLDTLAATLPKDPRGVPMSGAAGGLAGGLWAALGAKLVAGAPFVLEALGYDARMRAAHAVIVGEGRLDAQTLLGKAAGEAATRARQAGVPCFAIVGQNALDRFGARMLDLQVVSEAPTLA
ncbi:MAG TPA: glycerate kinase, partial [Solirubrobacteraceae bacterium]